jgi:hypothetical protein
LKRIAAGNWEEGEVASAQFKKSMDLRLMAADDRSLHHGAIAEQGLGRDAEASCTGSTAAGPPRRFPPLTLAGGALPGAQWVGLRVRATPGDANRKDGPREIARAEGRSR